LLGDFKLFFELPISLILGLVTNVDLVASRVRVDVIGFPIPLRDRQFIGSELLLLGVGNDVGSKACRRKQALCLLGTSTAHSRARRAKTPIILNPANICFMASLFC
jgi:hypothetical protein